MTDKAQRPFDVMKLRGLAELAAETQGVSEVCVAVIDGSVDREHPCFSRADLTEIDLHLGLSVNAQSGASREHGTYVTSLIFGQPDTGVTGIAPLCRGLLLPVYTTTRDGSGIRCNQLDLARAINAAADQGAHIINISGGELSPNGEMLHFLERAVSQCSARNILLIAAAGNHGCACLQVPAASPFAIAVGAEDADGRPLPFSNWGAAYGANGVLAPGENIPGAVPGGGVAGKTGTSCATPIVTSVAALLLSLQVAAGRRPDPSAVRRAILESAAACDPEGQTDCTRALRGRLDVAAARTLVVQDIDTPTFLVRATESASTSGTTHTINEIMTEPSERNIAMSHQNSTDANASHIEPSSAASNVGPSDLSLQGGSEIAQKLRSQAATIPGLAQRLGPSEMPRVTASECGCQVRPSSVAEQKAYVIGTLNVDFGTQARKDYVTQQMSLPGPIKPGIAEDPAELSKYLADNPADALAVNWIVSIDSTPVYALAPEDQFALPTYGLLLDVYRDTWAPRDADPPNRPRPDPKFDRMAVGGTIVGTTRLLNGHYVPTIAPVTRGLHGLATDDMVTAAIKQARDLKIARPDAEAPPDSDVKAGMTSLLNRLYAELRNLGQSSPDRALNYMAVNAYVTYTMYTWAAGRSYQFDHLEVKRSPICRPDSDCWDVTFIFFYITDPLKKPRHAFRTTVDVGDIIPVSVGTIQDWDIF